MYLGILLLLSLNEFCYCVCVQVIHLVKQIEYLKKKKKTYIKFKMKKRQNRMQFFVHIIIIFSDVCLLTFSCSHRLCERSHMKRPILVAIVKSKVNEMPLKSKQHKGKRNQISTVWMRMRSNSVGASVKMYVTYRIWNSWTLFQCIGPF